MKKGAAHLDDFLEQFQRIKKMGPLGQLVGMIPGLSQIKKQLNVDEMDESFFNQVEAIIHSMTKEERHNPEIIDGSRRRRIALGSGSQPADVNRVSSNSRSQEDPANDQHRPRLQNHAVPPVTDDPLIPHRRCLLLRIRLTRVGKKKQPAYRLVVADSRSPRDGAFLKIIGHYDPLSEPVTLVVKEEEAVHWLQKGAQPSETAAKLLTRIGVMERAGRQPVR